MDRPGFDPCFDVKPIELARPRTPEEAHAEAMALGADCRRCVRWNCREGPVLGEIVPNAPLLSIGMAPGSQEITEGGPFKGRSGQIYNAGLECGGLQRHEVSTTNVIKCKPAIEDFDLWLRQLARAGKPSPVECCRPLLDRDIRVSNSPVILAIGGVALKAVADRYGVPYAGQQEDTVGRLAFATIMEQFGSPLQMTDGRIIASTLHPSFALHDNHQYLSVIQHHIARAVRIAKRGYIDWPIAKPILQPTVEQVLTTCQLFLDKAPLAAVDIETDGLDVRRCRIRCIGLGANIDGQEVIIVVPLRWMDGRIYWPNAQARIVEDAIREVLDRCVLLFWNGNYDTAVLLENGLMSLPEKRWLDGMYAVHDCEYNDLPKSLGFAVRLLFEAPLWKKDVDNKQAAGVATDMDLWTYNGSGDIAGTLRAWPVLEQHVIACGNQAQFSIDTALAPVARDMGRLISLFIDERERGRISRELNGSVQSFGRRFRELAGIDINPRSFPQVKTWLYDELGLTPLINTQGYEFDADDGDEPSTSVSALLALDDNNLPGLKNADEKIRVNARLLDLGAGDQEIEVSRFKLVKAGLDAMIRFRACDKLRSTYVDNIKVSYDRRDCPIDSPVILEPVLVEDMLTGVSRTLVALGARPEISRLWITWSLHSIPSGRWTSDPSVNNWPPRGWIINGKPTNVRSMVVAPPGHVIVGADLEQVEARLYAVVANDRYMIQAFRDNLDVHALNAATIFAERDEDIMSIYHAFVRMKDGTEWEQGKIKFIRTLAKRVCFLKNYGGTDDKLYQTLANERDKATLERVFPNLKQDFVAKLEDRWDQRHSEGEVWRKSVGRLVRAQHFVEAPILGKRKRYFLGGPDKKNAPPNMIIQGGAREIVLRAILEIVQRIPFRKWSKHTGLCLDGHDYIGVTTTDDHAEEVAKILEEAMRFEMPCADGWMMPFPAEATISRNWSEKPLLVWKDGRLQEKKKS